RNGGIALLVNQRHDRITEQMPSPTHARIRHVTTSQSASCSLENEQTRATCSVTDASPNMFFGATRFQSTLRVGANVGSTERTAHAWFGSPLGRSLRPVGVAADAWQSAPTAREHRPIGQSAA